MRPNILGLLNFREQLRLLSVGSCLSIRLIMLKQARLNLRH